MMLKEPSRDEDISRDPQIEAAFARMVRQAEAPPDFVARVLAKADARPAARQTFFNKGPLWRSWPAPILARGAFVVGCALFFAVAVYQYVHRTQDNGRSAAHRDADTELATTEPLPDESLQHDILQRLASAQECAKITVDVRSGVVELGGRVASEAQRAEIHTMVQSTQGVVRVNDGLRIIPPAYCEVVELMESLTARAETQHLSWSASLKKVKRDGTLVPAEGMEPVYYAGERVAIEVRTPEESESYVYVDYYTGLGQVGHLFPPWRHPKLEPAGPLPPKTAFMIGHHSESIPWWITQIRPPFGQELITVIVSTAPLFPTVKASSVSSPSVPRRIGPAGSYIFSLRQALMQAGVRADVTGAFYVIRTQERPQLLP
jgi:hypothetical protein